MIHYIQRQIIIYTLIGTSFATSHDKGAVGGMIKHHA